LQHWATLRFSLFALCCGTGNKAADRQIDAPVYELYGLTDEEVEAVESLSALRGVKTLKE